MALTCDLNLPIKSVDCELNMDAPHSFTIQTYATTLNSLPSAGSNVTIKIDGNNYLYGTVTQISVDSDFNGTITGQDKASYYFENTYVEGKESSETTLSNLATVSATISNKITVSGSVPCYGYGTYTGNIQSYIERVANNFGLHYFYNPLAETVVLSTFVIDPDSYSRTTNVRTSEYSMGINQDNNIGKICLQKEFENDSNSSEIEIKNGSETFEFNEAIRNSITDLTGSAYPQTVFIDPGTWLPVTLYAQTNFTNFNQQIDIEDTRYLYIEEWSKQETREGYDKWHVYLYDEDGDEIGRIWNTGKNHAWSVIDSHKPAVKAVIAREFTQQTSTELEYPNFDGLIATVYRAEYAPTNTNITSWQGTYSSGDGGRTDTNIITEPMYPPQNQINGVRIAKRDSNPHANTITIPQVQSITPNFTTKYRNLTTAGEFPVVPVCLTTVNTENSTSSASTEITGEY